MMLHQLKSRLSSNLSNIWKRPMTMMQSPMLFPQRNFAMIDFKAIKSENSVSKVYNSLVEDG